MTTLDSTFGNNGKVTTDFGPGDDNIQSILLQADGKILVVGDSFNGSSYDFALARYNSNGSLDTTFGTGGRVTTNFGLTSAEDTGLDAVLQADGKILVGGTAFIGGDNDFALARYNRDGTLDTSFGDGGKASTFFEGGGDDQISSIVLQADGKILVAGRTSIGGNGSSKLNFALARYNSNGTLDTSFGTGGKFNIDFNSGEDVAYEVLLQPNGQILVGGQASNGFDLDFALARLALPPTVQFSQTTPYQAGEGAATTSVVNLVRSGDLTSASQVQLTITDGTATAGTDYTNTVPADDRLCCWRDE